MYYYETKHKKYGETLFHFFLRLVIKFLWCSSRSLSLIVTQLSLVLGCCIIAFGAYFEEMKQENS